MNDIQKKKPLILNLSYERQFRLSLTLILKSAIFLIAVSFFLFSFVYAPVYNFPSLTLAAPDAQADEERKNLENQLAELEKQIADSEAVILQYQKQGRTLQNEIKGLESQIAKLSLQIKTVNLNLEKLNQEISVTRTKISSVEENIAFNKKALSRVLQDVYENENKSLMEIFFTSPNLSNFFSNLNNLMLVQDNLRTALNKVTLLRTDLLDQKEQLALEKSDAEILKAYRANQKQDIEKNQSQKNEILKITKGKESEYKKIVTETKKTAAEIRKQIFRLLGGGELDFEKAYELAKFAEQATGVRAALILAVLDRESALGTNVGQCSYQTSMHPTRDIPVFLAIIQELGLQKNLESGVIKVSCANSDGAYGGALGPAQFIPSTWELYKNKITVITGSNPPNPWLPRDAFTASGIYLKELNALPGNFRAERTAALKYYAGSKWSSAKNAFYGNDVMKIAGEYQELIDTLQNN